MQGAVCHPAQAKPKIIEVFKRPLQLSSPHLIHIDLKGTTVEIIMDINIWRSKDLENLLAFYLLMNLRGYHDFFSPFSF